MWKTIVVITILLAALVGADVALSASEGNERASVKKVGRLVPKEERDRGQPAALVVDSAGKKTIYASTPNGWRCLTYRNAVAAQDAVQSVINKTFEAEGIVQSRDSALSHQYGLDVPSSMRLEVHGPKWEKDAKQDLIVAVDLGNPHIEKDGSFMRRAGETAIWSVDSNPHLELDVPAGSPLPAMLDPSIVPTYWLQQAKQVRTIRIERAGAPVLEMEIRDKQISPEEMRQGKLPFDWYCKSNDAEKLCDPNASMAYTSYLMRAPYLDVIDPVKAANLGFDKSIARIVLGPREGAPMELYIAASPMAGRRNVYNSISQSAFELPEEFANWLIPTEEQLVNPAAPNPWKAFLQARQPR